MRILIDNAPTRGHVSSRNVRGSLFVDYVRLIRSAKHVEWERHLEPEDMAYLQQRVDDARWYPMSTFERFGLGILSLVAQGSVAMVHDWGRHQVDSMLRLHPGLIEPDDARESLMRVAVHRRGFFDYEVLTVREVTDGHALLGLSYQMSDVAELAACMQTMGAFRELLERAYALSIEAHFASRRWEGEETTTLELTWK